MSRSWRVLAFSVDGGGGGRAAPAFCASTTSCTWRHWRQMTRIPRSTRLRTKLDQRIGEVQLPEVILAVDAEVRFSWIMLGREPRTGQELLMAYAGILAHGTSLTAAECARMIPQLSATSIRQAMRWAGDERRLAQACQAVLEFMQRHPSRRPGAEPIWPPRT